MVIAGRAADVKRCYSSWGALALLDFDDPSIQGVQALMVRVAMLPPFLRCADGRKFIAHLFTLHVSLQCTLHGWLQSSWIVCTLSSSVLIGAIWALPEMKPPAACTSALLMRTEKLVHASLPHTQDAAAFSMLRLNITGTSITSAVLLPDMTTLHAEQQAACTHDETAQ